MECDLFCPRYRMADRPDIYMWENMEGPGSTSSDVTHHMDNNTGMSLETHSNGPMTRPPPPMAHSGHGGHLFQSQPHSQPSTPAPPRHPGDIGGGPMGGGIPGTPTPTPVSNPTTSPLVVPQPMKPRTIKTYHCRMCDQEFPNKSEMTRHSKDVHGMEEKGHKCPKCFKSFPTSQQLAQHSLVHTNIRKFHCHYCEKSFKQLSHVQQHQRIHTGERPYKCTVETCTKAFAQLANLQQHLKNHDSRAANSDKKPYCCSTCDRRFATEASLNHHVTKVHVFKRTLPLTTQTIPKTEANLALPSPVSVTMATTPEGLPPLPCNYFSSETELLKISENAVLNFMKHSMLKALPAPLGNQLDLSQLARMISSNHGNATAAGIQQAHCSNAINLQTAPQDRNTTMTSPHSSGNSVVLTSQLGHPIIHRQPEGMSVVLPRLPVGAEPVGTPQTHGAQTPCPTDTLMTTLKTEDDDGSPETNQDQVAEKEIKLFVSAAETLAPGNDSVSRSASYGLPLPTSSARLSDISKKDLNLLKSTPDKLYSFPSQVTPLSPTLYTDQPQQNNDN